MDTINSINTISPEVQNYIYVLEKTNQQLSLWYNPYGVAVGILAVLFGVLAIAATIIIFRQSHDYKDKLEADREFYRKKMEEFLGSQTKIIEERSRTAEELSKNVDNTLKEYKKKLENSSKEQKKEIQRAIDRLELEKISIKADVGSFTVYPNSDSSVLSYNTISGTKLHKCSSCGFGFYVNNNPFYSVITLSNTVTCPKCGNVDNL